MSLSSYPMVKPLLWVEACEDKRVVGYFTSSSPVSDFDYQNNWRVLSDIAYRLKKASGADQTRVEFVSKTEQGYQYRVTFILPLGVKAVACLSPEVFAEGIVSVEDVIVPFVEIGIQSFSVSIENASAFDDSLLLPEVTAEQRSALKSLKSYDLLWGQYP